MNIKTLREKKEKLEVEFGKVKEELGKAQDAVKRLYEYMVKIQGAHAQIDELIKEMEGVPEEKPTETLENSG